MKCINCGAEFDRPKPVRGSALKRYHRDAKSPYFGDTFACSAQCRHRIWHIRDVTYRAVNNTLHDLKLRGYLGR